MFQKLKTYLSGSVVRPHPCKFSVFNDVSCSITFGRPSEKSLQLTFNSVNSLRLLRLQGIA